MSSSFGTTEVTTSSAPAWQRLLTCSARHAGTLSIALLSTSTSRFLRSSDPSTARVPCEHCQVKHNHSLSNAPADCGSTVTSCGGTTSPWRCSWRFDGAPSSYYQQRRQGAASWVTYKARNDLL